MASLHGSACYMEMEDSIQEVRRRKPARHREKHLGADGMIARSRLTTIDKGHVYYYKGMLFQAKKGKAEPARRQAEQMESFAKTGSAVFVYGPDRYEAISSEKLLSTKDAVVIKKESVRALGDFLAKSELMPCNVGIQGLAL